MKNAKELKELAVKLEEEKDILQQRVGKCSRVHEGAPSARAGKSAKYEWRQ